jgi:hypothetical protein
MLWWRTKQPRGFVGILREYRPLFILYNIRCTKSINPDSAAVYAEGLPLAGWSYSVSRVLFVQLFKAIFSFDVDEKYFINIGAYNMKRFIEWLKAKLNIRFVVRRLRERYYNDLVCNELELLVELNMSGEKARETYKFQCIELKSEIIKFKIKLVECFM